jgi:hypothetical protein
MRLPPADRLFPRLAAGAFLALAPKCLLCAAAYASLGAALRLGGPEICGAPTGVTPDHPAWPAMLGIISCATLWFTTRRRKAGVILPGRTAWGWSLIRRNARLPSGAPPPAETADSWDWHAGRSW